MEANQVPLSPLRQLSDAERHLYVAMQHLQAAIDGGELGELELFADQTRAGLMVCLQEIRAHRMVASLREVLP